MTTTWKASRQILVNEIMKTKPNGSLIKKEMDVTFALRRKEVEDKPEISQMVHRWPALFLESQVCMIVLNINKKDYVLLCSKCNVDKM